MARSARRSDREGTTSGLVLKVATIVAAAGFVPACVSYITSRQQLAAERDELTEERQLSAGRLEAAYILLPDPERLTQPSAAAEAGELDAILDDFKVVLPGDSVREAPVTLAEMRSDFEVGCTSARCRTLLQDAPPDGGPASGYIYLALSNTGAKVAQDVEVTMHTVFVDQAETGSLARALSGPAGDELVERVGDVAPGERLLVPLSVVAIVNDTYPFGVVAFGPARLPTSVTWRDPTSDASRSATIRSPADESILVPFSTPILQAG